MIDMSYYRAIQNTTGIGTKKEMAIEAAKRDLTRGLQQSIHLEQGLRNGVQQRFIAVPSQVRYKYEIEAMPGEALDEGDIIELYDQHWIVVECKVVNLIQKTGLIWACNHLFRFQNCDGTIYERWGVFDSGVYSTTTTGSTQVQRLDKQFKVYLPYDDETKMIYEDKRFAVDVMYDNHGREILETYCVTGRTKIAKSFSPNAHLLILDSRSSIYSPASDNLAMMLCDYITPASQDEPNGQRGHCEISSRKILRIGGSATMRGAFYTAEGDLVTEGIVPVWSIETDLTGVTLSQDGHSAVVYVPDKEEYIGSFFTVHLVDEAGLFEGGWAEVEVVDIG